MPQNRKPAARRQQQGAGRQDLGLVRTGGSPGPAPASSAKWLAATKARWAEFWASDVALVAERGSDLPALTRLFGYYDEMERSVRALHKQRFVKGSTGQPRLNPAAKYVTELEGLIRQLEDRFGLTPMARLKLGVEFAGAYKSLQELNASFSDDTLEVENDPRLAVVEGSAA